MLPTRQTGNCGRVMGRKEGLVVWPGDVKGNTWGQTRSRGKFLVGFRINIVEGGKGFRPGVRQRVLGSGRTWFKGFGGGGKSNGVGQLKKDD